MFNAKKIAKQWPEFRGEKQASLGNDWVWKAVVTYYHTYYNLYKLGYIKGNLDQFVMEHLCESINNN